MSDTTFTIKRMPISQAFQWLKNAWLIITAQTWILCITVAWVCLILLLLVAYVPFVGGALACLILPALSFGMAHVSQKVRLQEKISPFDVFSGFHPNHRTRLLTVGACLALLLVGTTVLLMQQIDVSVIQDFNTKIMSLGENMNATTVQPILEQARLDPKFISTLILVYGYTFLNLLIIALFNYAPLFVVWQHKEALPAIGLSIKLILKNILPLALVVIIITMAGFMALLLVALLVTLGQIIGIWVAMLLAFAFIAYMFALVFCSYHNIITSSIAK